jgi:hypothetical protein
VIYGIVEDGDWRFVKIGVTGKGAVDRGLAMRRLQELQTGNPRALVLAALVDGGPDDERKLHVDLAVHRVRGEWFLHVGAVAEWVSRNRVLTRSQAVSLLARTETDEPAEASSPQSELSSGRWSWRGRVRVANSETARVERCNWCDKTGHTLAECVGRRSWSLADAVGDRVRRGR